MLRQELTLEMLQLVGAGDVAVGGFRLIVARDGFVEQRGNTWCRTVAILIIT